MAVIGPVSFAGFLFAGKWGEAYQFFFGILPETSPADRIPVLFTVNG